jgi:hypothetical protein
MSNSNEFMAGFTGCKVISNTSANTGRWKGFIVNSDAVVSAISFGETSLLSELGLSGVTLKQGIFITVKEEQVITSITLTSGSIVLYNE